MSNSYNFERALYVVIGAMAGAGIYLLVACAPLDSIGQAADSVAAVAAAAEPIIGDISAAESPRDWFDIAWKIGVGLGVLGGGGEIIRRRRNRANV